MTIQIDKNIPIPENKFSPMYGDTIRQMEVGDSVLLATAKEAKSFAQALRNMGFGQKTARVEGGFRVWKRQIIAK